MTSQEDSATLARIADGQDRLVATLTAVLHPAGNAAASYVEKLSATRYDGAEIASAPSDMTIEAIWDKARQLHAVCQDLGTAFSSMIYGMQPQGGQDLASPPSSADRLQSTWETLDAMRRRA